MTLGKITLAAMLLASAGTAQAVVHTVKIDAVYQPGALRAGQALRAEFSYDDVQVANFVNYAYGNPNYPVFIFNSSPILTPLTVRDASGEVILAPENAVISASSFPNEDILWLRGQTAGQPYLEVYLTSRDTNFIVNGLPASIPNVSANQFGGYVVAASGSATITNIAFDVQAVPEPATWGLMILGFGLAGGALRRRAVQAIA